MGVRGPARLLVDEAGNPVSVTLDGTTYRLQVEAVIVDAGGKAVDTETEGNRTGEAISYPALLAAVCAVNDKLERVLAHLATITGEEDPL